MRNLKNKLIIVYLKFIRHPIDGYRFRKRAKLSNQDIIPNGKQYYLGIVAIFRGEDDYLKEWIEFHKLMGVEHFILYDNGLEESSKQLLNPYINRGMVTHIPFPNIDGLKDGRHAHTLSLQQMAYADCIKRFKNHFKYLLQLDIDEFLFPKTRNTIPDVLRGFEDKKVARIEVNWTNFGNSYHVKKPQGLVIENFTRSGDKIVSTTVKSFSNTKYLSKYFVYSNVHRFALRFSLKDILTKIILNYPKIIKNEEANNLFQLNHYITKSEEEYLSRAKKFKKGWQTGKKTEDLFNSLNMLYNQSKNTKIHKYLSDLQQKIYRNN